MPTYLVDRNVPGLTRDQFRAAQRALGNAARRAAESGRPVRYVRAVFVLSEGRAMCLFEAPDACIVRAVNLEAGVPFTQVVEAVDLVAEPDHDPQEEQDHAHTREYRGGRPVPGRVQRRTGQRGPESDPRRD